MASDSDKWTAKATQKKARTIELAKSDKYSSVDKSILIFEKETSSKTMRYQIVEPPSKKKEKK